MSVTFLPRRWRLVLALWGISALVHAAAVRPGAQLLADGIPVFEGVVHRQAQEPAALGFQDWHPQRAEMLVLMRAGGSPQLHRLGAAGAKPERLTEGRDGVESARWEPEQGEYLVFSRDQGGNEAWQLYRWQAGAAAQRITGATGRVSEYQFLPKARGLVYLWEQLDRHDAAAEGERQAHSQLVWVDPLAPAKRRVLAELKGGRFVGLRVTPRGAIVLTQVQNGSSRLMRVPAAGGPLQALASVKSAGEGRDGDGDGEELLWRRQAVRGEFRHLSTVGLDSGLHQQWLSDIAADLEAFALAPAGSGLPMALVYNEQGLSTLRWYDPVQRSVLPAALPLPAGVLRNPRWHPRLPLLAFDHVSAQHPGRIWVYAHDQQVLTPWSGEAGAASELEYRTLRWKSFDGLEISGLHLAPPARFKGPRPVYISIHGGPAAQARPSYVSGTLRYLVEVLGMHVIQPNVRGSDGFGKRFLMLDNGRLREDSVRDVSALLDLIAGRAEMDAARVVVAGGSYGGYMSLAVAVRESARIAGSICRVGIANFVSFLENTESYRRDNRRAEYGDERDPAMREFLQGISPLNHAEQVRKPLFVVHGRNDPRVPYAEAERMVLAVRAQGTPVWFLTAEDEGHRFTKSDNRDFLFQSTIEFVRRLLGGSPMGQGEAVRKPEDALGGATAP
ncbi:prolyl oligopeptidase family serine peptidase [Paucibacter sp. APW11]|uniref:Prolyl oligopeptidase family serine peptidase n=1 Tax=Roseateles aquae TaxID=3077235 RepID=A0ABU3PDX6_9BURK|nr:prolyl oligopeptidase family serine peptidase [Paucibacter sp. APW11]MDT9000091.1 prolyl oligopeptidase family serine peptidase [Paucibacter sp. APW11]